MLQGMRSKQSTSQVDDIARQADDLARKQQEFEGQLRKAFGKEDGLNRSRPASWPTSGQDEVASS